MNAEQPRAIRLADYQPVDYRITDVALEFDIRDGVTTVTSRLSVIRENPDADSLWLDGDDLELVSLRLDGELLSANAFQLTNAGLNLSGLRAQHEITVTTRIKPEENNALEGLYKSSQMYCTQCEAQGFRKITYYQDRPDVLAKFTTTIIANDSYPTLLSNGNLVQEGRSSDGRRQVTWEDPFPKPSYLFALVAGNLQMKEDIFTTMSGRDVVLRIFSEAHNIEQCDYAMDVLKRSMAWDEQRFGREYDLDIFMIVAVEDFNMGAMENKGLNIFNTSCVLASPDTATDAAYQRVEVVVAHEYFHNWSGNRVTCRDWFQLSLKEGFTVFRDAEFSADMNSRSVKRIEDVGFLRSVQFAEDGGPLAHPVRPSSYIEISNFYTTTIYEKGAEVVRMYQTLLGREAFRQGSDLYFQRFDGSAATTDDFTAVMAEAGQLDLNQFKTWYDQAGTPRVDVKESFVDGVLSLTISQACPATPGQAVKQPFHMPLKIGLLGSEGAVDLASLQIDCDQVVRLLVEEQSLLLELRAPETVLRVTGLEAQPVVSFLREFSAPVKVNYARPQTDLAYLVQADSDGFVRWDALQTLWVQYFQGNTTIDLPALVCEVAASQLNTSDPADQLLAATMLTVPEENYLFEQLDTFDVSEVIEDRETARQAIAAEKSALWASLYERYSQDQAYLPDATGNAARTLANIALANMALTSKGDALEKLIFDHYEKADNLTDRRAALQVALNHPDLAAASLTDLLNDFYQRWENEALVIDIWFSLQAQSPLTTVSRLHELEAHPSFDLKNPNRVRSLFGAFGMYNHHRFHALDGSGYVYLGDAINRLDALNPQISARLTTPLSRWQRYDPIRQRLMQQVLSELAAREGISRDLYEVVNKSLGEV